MVAKLLQTVFSVFRRLDLVAFLLKAARQQDAIDAVIIDNQKATGLVRRLHTRNSSKTSAALSYASPRTSSLFPISRLFSLAMDSSSFASAASSAAPKVFALDFNE